MDAAFDAIERSVKRCGYRPYRVDRESHNNKIDDEIIANIRISRLVVADLTGVRPNVFYEAGFAHGLGIPVLLTCNESYAGYVLKGEPNAETAPNPETGTWFSFIESQAFDIRQYPVLVWSTHDELCSRLENRMRALKLALTPPAVV
jgi:hypothetical protein